MSPEAGNRRVLYRESDYGLEYRKLGIRIAGLLSTNKENEDSIVFGPSYFATTSSGMRVTIDSLIRAKGEEITQYILLCCDEQGKVLGHTVGTRGESEGGTISFVNNIHTRAHNGGIGTVIASAEYDLLGRFADIFGRNVTLEVLDHNADVLGLAQRAHRTNPTQETKENLERLHKQRKSWDALYSGDGIFPPASRLFRPKPSKELKPENWDDFRHIMAITLERNTDRRYRAARVTKLSEQDMLDRHNIQRVNFLKKI